MSSPHRKRRGMETQAAVAAYLRDNGWQFATDAGAGRSGRDILNTIGLAIEVKARRDYNPLAWLRQAVASAAGDLPMVVHRPDGIGPASIADWPVTFRLEDAVNLLHSAGYGDPTSARPADLRSETPK